MTRLYILDAGPVGLVTNPKESDEARRCKAWLRAALHAGARVLVAEVTDYEVRRELLRSGKVKGLARLDALEAQLGLLPVTSAVWRRRPGARGGRPLPTRPSTRM